MLRLTFRWAILLRRNEMQPLTRALRGERIFDRSGRPLMQTGRAI